MLARRGRGRSAAWAVVGAGLVSSSVVLGPTAQSALENCGDHRSNEFAGAYTTFQPSI